jgi:FkbM family methyltransferase
MSVRRILVLSLPSTFLVVIGLGVYLHLTWPYPPPDYSKVPFALRIEGMPGVRMYLHQKDSVITPTIVSTGSWEAAETAQFLRKVKPGDIFVDAGANVGYYTIIGSRLVGDKGKVYAFEPDPKSFEMLRRNVRLNGLTNVVLEQKALSNAKGVIKLFIADQNKGDHRIYQPEGESRRSVEVEAVRLDEYFEGRGRRIDVLKMDTQGAEGLILEGATGLLLEDRTDGPTIFMEFWPYALKQMGTDPGGLVKTLQSYHYRFYDVKNSDPKVGPKRVEPAELDAFPVEEPQSTDLILVREGREPKDGLDRLGRATLRKSEGLGPTALP